MASGYPDYSGQTNPEVDFTLKSFSTTCTLAAGNHTYTRDIISGKFFLRWIEAKVQDLLGCGIFSVTYSLDSEIVFYWGPFVAYKPIQSPLGDMPGLDVIMDIKHDDYKAHRAINMYCEGSLTERISYVGLLADETYTPFIAYKDLTS